MLSRASAVLACCILAGTGVLADQSGARADTPCAKELQLIGLCAAENSGTEITIEGTKSNPGTSPLDFADDTSDNDRRGLTDPLGRCEVSAQHLKLCRPSPIAPSVGTPAITITDLAQFAPDPVATTGEPDNLGVAGMPTNFVAAASAHTRTGALFRIPLTVRFTPVGYDFRYGDGDAASTTTGGQPWAALGQASFTPTATSHIYAERGTYDAGVTVRYTAEVDLGIGWFPVAGQLSIAGPTQQIRIFEAHTALVARTCAEQPAAPGC